MGARIPPLTDDQIKEKIAMIFDIVNQGNSIEVARQKARVNNPASVQYKQVTRHPLYVEILNYYLAKCNKNYHFVIENNEFKAKPRPQNQKKN